jgi:hypothetical protein
VDILNKAKEQTERDKRFERRQKLFHILQAILSGELDSSKAPLSKLFNQRVPRLEYVSPNDRSTYNSRYMELQEMLSGTPFYE